MTNIINLYGGPGTGKSTSAAVLFSELKQHGINAELVREYAKDWAWDKREISTYDQLYFMGKQIRRESMLYGKVDWIVTDSPILLSVYYSNRYAPVAIADGIDVGVNGFYRQAERDGHRHIHIFLNRTKTYNPTGRYQDEVEARSIDQQLLTLLNKTFPFETYDTDRASLLLGLSRWLDSAARSG